MDGVREEWRKFFPATARRLTTVGKICVDLEPWCREAEAGSAADERALSAVVRGFNHITPSPSHKRVRIIGLYRGVI